MQFDANFNVIPESKKETQTFGFGVMLIAGMAPHQILVEIDGRNTVRIIEDLGLSVVREGSDMFRHRAHLSRDAWDAVAARVTARFNRRLTERDMKPSKFKSGQNRVDRLLGRELLVLAWGIEDMTPEEAVVAARSWDAYRFEENLWLYQQIARVGGGLHDSPRTGWRMAIKHALIETTMH